MNPNGASVPNYNRVNEWPLQFLRTGVYLRSHGYSYARTANGGWWSDMADSDTRGRALSTWPGNAYVQNSDLRGNGFALRCGGAVYKK